MMWWNGSSGPDQKQSPNPISSPSGSSPGGFIPSSNPPPFIMPTLPDVANFFPTEPHHQSPVDSTNPSLDWTSAFFSGSSSTSDFFQRPPDTASTHTESSSSLSFRQPDLRFQPSSATDYHASVASPNVKYGSAPLQSTFSLYGDPNVSSIPSLNSIQLPQQQHQQQQQQQLQQQQQQQQQQQLLQQHPARNSPILPPPSETRFSPRMLPPPSSGAPAFASRSVSEPTSASSFVKPEPPSDPFHFSPPQHRSPQSSISSPLPPEVAQLVQNFVSAGGTVTPGMISALIANHERGSKSSPPFGLLQTTASPPLTLSPAATGSTQNTLSPLSRGSDSNSPREESGLPTISPASRAHRKSVIATSAKSLLEAATIAPPVPTISHRSSLVKAEPLSLFEQRLPGETTEEMSARIAQMRNRLRTPVACVLCHKAKTSCDRNRPCQRCIRLGKPQLCQDRPHAKKGRPRKNRGIVPPVGGAPGSAGVGPSPTGSPTNALSSSAPAGPSFLANRPDSMSGLTINTSIRKDSYDEFSSPSSGSSADDNFGFSISTSAAMYQTGKAPNRPNAAPSLPLFSTPSAGTSGRSPAHLSPGSASSPPIPPIARETSTPPARRSSPPSSKTNSPILRSGPLTPPTIPAPSVSVGTEGVPRPVLSLLKEKTREKSSNFLFRSQSEPISTPMDTNVAAKVEDGKASNKRSPVLEADPTPNQSAVLGCDLPPELQPKEEPTALAPWRPEPSIQSTQFPGRIIDSKSLLQVLHTVPDVRPLISQLQYLPTTMEDLILIECAAIQRLSLEGIEVASQPNLQLDVYKIIYQRMPFGVYVVPLRIGASGSTGVWFNEMFCEMLGYSNAEMKDILSTRQRAMSLLYVEDEREPVLADITGAVKRMATSWSSKITYRHKSGHRIPTISSRAYQYDNGVCVTMTTFVQYDPHAAGSKGIQIHRTTPVPSLPMTAVQELIRSQKWS